MHDLRTLTFQDGILSCAASESVTSEELLHRGNVFESVVVLGLLKKPKQGMLHDVLDGFKTKGRRLPIYCEWDDDSRALKLDIPPDFHSRNFFISLDGSDGCST